MRSYELSPIVICSCSLWVSPWGRWDAFYMAAFSSRHTPCAGMSAHGVCGLLWCLNAALLQLHVESQAADFVGEHLEAGGGAGFERVFAFDHRFVNLRAPLDVVALDGQQLLQDVSGAIGFQRPDFHLPKALAAKAGLAAERLLGD